MHKYKKNRKKRIQKACKDQDKDNGADLIFWHYHYKNEFSIFLISYLLRRLNQKLKSFKLFIPYSLQLIFGCFSA